MNIWSRYFNSLKSRLILSALLMVVVLLPIVGLTLSNAYQKHMQASIENELVAYSYSILAVAEVEQGQLIMPEALAENLFNTSESGLYALIVAKEKVNEPLWLSPSLLTMAMPQNLRAPQIGNGDFYPLELEQHKHFVYSFSVNFTEDEQANEMTLHIIKRQSDYLALMNDFKRQLWFGLLALMAILLLLQFVWLKWSLKPLVVLKKEIADVEQGRSNRLVANYPEELQAVKAQLNGLLTTEQNQRQRYRNALSDLAHSLKTPLAVLQGQIGLQADPDVKQQGQAQIDVMNMMVEHQLKRAQSAGQSSWHLGVEIAPVVKKLLTSLQKIYRDKQLTYHCHIETSQVFKGDEADLLEILGNLLDNASKAAKMHVSLEITGVDNRLTISVEDDGKGIAIEQADALLMRGTRADTYAKGHGIGLAIVRDLVASYQGQLTIGKSDKYQGAKFSISFSDKN